MVLKPAVRISPNHKYPPTYAPSITSTTASTARIGAAVEGREVI